MPGSQTFFFCTVALICVMAEGVAAPAGRAAAGSPPSEAAPTGKPDHVRNEKLRKELHDMVAEDQEIRLKWVKDWKNKAVIQEMQATDAKDLARMREIIREFGWPGTSLVGKEGSHDAWLLVQHDDSAPEFQKQCLVLMEQAAKKGEASPVDVAYLTDRVLVHEGKKQLYGTQARRLPDGQFVVNPIQDEKNVDRRRKAAGMPSLAEYLKAMKEFYSSAAAGTK